MNAFTSNNLVQDQDYKKLNYTISDKTKQQLELEGIIVLGNSDGEDEKDALVIQIRIEDCFIDMEIDSGSKYSVISDICWREYFRNFILKPIDINLLVLTGEYVKVLGYFQIKVYYPIKNENSNQSHLLDLIVVQTHQATDFLPLMGRMWLNVLFKNWRSFFTENILTNTESPAENYAIRECLLKYRSVFNKDYRNPIKGISVEISLNRNVIPSVQKPKTIPFGFKDMVNAKIDRLLNLGILLPSKCKFWSWPIAVYKTDDDTIEIFPDTTGYGNVFDFWKLNEYQLSNRENVLFQFIGCTYFCKIQLTDIFKQIKISEECQRYLTITTTKGLFCYTRLPFGLNILPKCIEYVLNKVVKDLKLVKVYKDCVLIGGRNLSHCKRNCHLVLDKFQEYNVKINLRKCQLFQTKVKFFGYTLSSKDGILPQMEKLNLQHSSITPPPCHFIESLRNGEIYKNFKRWFCDPDIFTHYDPDRLLCIVSAASQNGIAGTLFHLYDNGESKPIKFAFATLSSEAQRLYSKLEMEIFAIIQTIKQSIEYLNGQKFIIFTDQEDFEAILSPVSNDSYCSCMDDNSIERSESFHIRNYRIQQWLLYLNQFNYEIIYEKTSMILYSYLFSHYSNKFTLSSKCDLKNNKSVNFEDEENIFKISELLKGFPIDFECISNETNSDYILNKIRNCILFKDSNSNSNYFTDLNFNNGVFPFNFKTIPLKFSIQSKCLMYGSRLCIPDSLKIAMLKILHYNHINSFKMNNIAKMSIWWINIKKDIELYVKNCEICNSKYKI